VLTTDQKELREERRAICQAEKVAPAEIEHIFNCYPGVYGTEETALRLGVKKSAEKMI